MTDANLPAWASELAAGVFAIDADVAYPDLLAEYRSLADGLNPSPDLGDDPHVAELRKLDPDNLNQYWLEVVYQTAKLDLRRALLLAGENAWPREIRIRGDKRKWAQKLYPEGRSVLAATKGKEARRLYVMLRGFLPN